MKQANNILRAGVYILLFLSSSAAQVYASDSVGITRENASFEEVRLELENAIVEKGFVIDFNGNIAKMLENTADVADNAEPVYWHAEFWQFCSSAITRKLTSLNPINIRFCPFVVFAYETVKDPGVITIGYRPLTADASAHTNETIHEINALLESIVVSAGQ